MSDRNVSEVHLLRDLEENLHLLSSEQRVWYQNAYFPYKPNADLWYPDQYRDHANLIIHAETNFAKRYCLCGAMGSTCNHREFCSRCADLEWRKKYSAFEHCYHRGPWNFITISFGGGLNLANRGTQEDAVAHWTAIKEQFNQWLKEYSVPGAIICEETAVLSFLPCIVLPHAHALVNGVEITEGMRADLENRISASVQGKIGGNALVTRVHITEIEDEDAFREKFKYLYKPITRISERYQKAWDEVQGNLRGVIQLNSNVKEFIRWTGTGTMAKGIRCYGNMYCRDPEAFIGDATKLPRKNLSNKPPKKKKRRSMSVVEIMEQEEREELTA